MDEYTLNHGDLVLGSRYDAGILTATVNGQEILVKDAANRKRGSLRDSIPNGTDIKREYATYLFAKMVPGLVEVPAMAYKVLNGEELLLMEKVTGASHPDWDEMPKGISLTVKRNMALFDAIVGNTDRHERNWFYKRNAKGERRVIAIDHGLCFPIPVSGIVDVGTCQFLRSEALPKWGLRWLNTVMDKEVQIRKTLAPYLEREAINEIFVRVSWMIGHGTFMSHRNLRYYAR